jgi:hypothetical protein
MTNWNTIYFRIASSSFKDDRWNAENFSKQKVSDMVRVLKWLESHEINHFNAASITTAKLATVVVSALGGKKSKVKAEDFLPFDTRRIKKDTGISDATLLVMKKLLKTRRLDGRVVALLAEELKTASVRNVEE